LIYDDHIFLKLNVRSRPTSHECSKFNTSKKQYQKHHSSLQFNHLYIIELGKYTNYEAKSLGFTTNELVLDIESSSDFKWFPTKCNSHLVY